MGKTLDKPWLRQYPADSLTTVNVDAYPSIVAMVLEACDRFADRPAFSNFGATLTYGDAGQYSRDFAAYLQSHAGVKKGDRVAIMLPNMLAFPVASFGILRAGAVQVNINPLYTPRELRHQLIDADTEIIVIYAGATSALAEIIAETPVRHIIVVGLDDLIGQGLESPSVDERLQVTPFIAALQAGKELMFSEPDIQGSDLAFLQYTGGTTGLSKGAMLTNRNLIANIMQYKGFAGEILNRPDEVVMTALPLYHIFALMVNLLTYFHLGAISVLITNPRDLPALIAEWSKWRVTTFTAVNTLLNGLLHTPGFSELDFSGLDVVVGGGMAVQESVSNRWKEVTGRHINQGYGLSETSPVLTLNVIGDHVFRGSIGLPFPDTDIVLRDEEGNDVPMGEPGELCAKGPQVMQGYWRKEEATAEVMTRDGYFRTGDIATMDELGYFRIVDRKKDMILVSGFNVFPNEVEAEVAAMPGVLECACVGIPDDRTGEAVRLFVVKRQAQLSAADVIAYCRETLTPYKVPSDVVFIDEVPKSAVGKLLRRELRDRQV